MSQSAGSFTCPFDFESGEGDVVIRLPGAEPAFLARDDDDGSVGVDDDPCVWRVQRAHDATKGGSDSVFVRLVHPESGSTLRIWKNGKAIDANGKPDSQRAIFAVEAGTEENEFALRSDRFAGRFVCIEDGDVDVLDGDPDEGGCWLLFLCEQKEAPSTSGAPDVVGPEAWTPAMVLEWLELKQVHDKIRKAVEEAEVDGSDLLDLDLDTICEDLKLTKMKAKKLLRLVDKLKSGEDPDAARVGGASGDSDDSGAEADHPDMWSADQVVSWAEDVLGSVFADALAEAEAAGEDLADITVESAKADLRLSGMKARKLVKQIAQLRGGSGATLITQRSMTARRPQPIARPGAKPAIRRRKSEDDVKVRDEDESDAERQHEKEEAMRRAFAEDERVQRRMQKSRDDRAAHRQKMREEADSRRRKREELESKARERRQSVDGNQVVLRWSSRQSEPEADMPLSMDQEPRKLDLPQAAHAQVALVQRETAKTMEELEPMMQVAERLREDGLFRGDEDVAFGFAQQIQGIALELMKGRANMVMSMKMVLEVCKFQPGKEKRSEMWTQLHKSMDSVIECGLEVFNASAEFQGFMTVLRTSMAHMSRMLQEGGTFEDGVAYLAQDQKDFEEFVEKLRDKTLTQTRDCLDAFKEMFQGLPGAKNVDGMTQTLENAHVKRLDATMRYQKLRDEKGAAIGSIEAKLIEAQSRLARAELEVKFANGDISDYESQFKRLQEAATRQATRAAEAKDYSKDKWQWVKKVKAFWEEWSEGRANALQKRAMGSKEHLEAARANQAYWEGERVEAEGDVKCAEQKLKRCHEEWKERMDPVLAEVEKAKGDIDKFQEELREILEHTGQNEKSIGAFLELTTTMVPIAMNQCATADRLGSCMKFMNKQFRRNTELHTVANGATSLEGALEAAHLKSLEEPLRELGFDNAQSLKHRDELEFVETVEDLERACGQKLKRKQKMDLRDLCLPGEAKMERIEAEKRTKAASADALISFLDELDQSLKGAIRRLDMGSIGRAARAQATHGHKALK